MIQATEEEVAKWKHVKETAGGDACCATGDLTPEQKIVALIPKLNEVLYEVINEPPFHRATQLVTQAGPIAIKQ
jgi:hypothetical protein